MQIDSLIHFRGAVIPLDNADDLNIFLDMLSDTDIVVDYVIPVAVTVIKTSRITQVGLPASKPVQVMCAMVGCHCYKAIFKQIFGLETQIGNETKIMEILKNRVLATEDI